MKRQKLRGDVAGYKKLSGKDSDEDGEEMKWVTHRTQYQEPPIIEKEVEDGDTLQSLSIRYHCSVAELKRLNQVLNDNEIFAKRTIKLPHRPFTAILAGVHSSGRSSPNGKTKAKKAIDTDTLEHKLHAFLTVPSGSKDRNTSSFNEVIFNSNLSSKTCDEDDNEMGNSSEEEVKLLPKEAVTEPVVVSKYFCSDSDISWIALFCCVIVIVLVVPLYVFYAAEHHTNHNSTNS